MTVRILIGDVRERLKDLPDESVHCTVTSPPYYGLRNYGVDGQIGLEKTFIEYVETLVSVFREVRRVLRKDGTCWLNLGDSYASGKGTCFNPGGNTSSFNIHLKEQNVHPLDRGNKSSLAKIGLKPKDLIGIPWAVAVALRTDGWWLRQDIIWHKPNPMPESTDDRCTKSHEYLFLLTKSARYYYNAEAIAEEASSDDLRRPYGSPGANELDPRGKQGEGKPRKIKVPGGWDRGEGAHGTIHRSGRTSAEYQTAVVKATRNKRSVWTVATEAFSEAHFATFPSALIEPCILAGCPPGGTILDPFGGAGTTGLVADRLQRNAILIELNPAYAAMAEQRIHGDAPLFSPVEAL